MYVQLGEKPLLKSSMDLVMLFLERRPEPFLQRFIIYPPLPRARTIVTVLARGRVETVKENYTFLYRPRLTT